MQNTSYSIDLSTFRIETLKNRLKNTRLLPSQKILGEDIDERFECLKQHDVQNLQQLQEALKTKSAVQSFADTTGLPVDYLTILRREVNSYQPKPIEFKDFPGINPDVTHKLRLLGIKHTEQLFPNILTREARDAFAQQHQIDADALLELTKLTDLARLKWVGPKFAKLLVESGYDTVEKIAHSNHEELYLALVRANKASGTYQGKFGAEDIKLWVNGPVQDVPLAIHF